MRVTLGGACGEREGEAGVGPLGLPPCRQRARSSTLTPPPPLFSFSPWFFFVLSRPFPPVPQKMSTGDLDNNLAAALVALRHLRVPAGVVGEADG